MKPFQTNPACDFKHQQSEGSQMHRFIYLFYLFGAKRQFCANNPPSLAGSAVVLDGPSQPIEINTMEPYWDD